jgi:hypothetical protein
VRIALLIREVREGVRRPGVLRVLGEGSFDLWASGIPLSILRERHPMMGREPPIVAVAGRKLVRTRLAAGGNRIRTLGPPAEIEDLRIPRAGPFCRDQRNQKGCRTNGRAIEL